MDKDPKFDFLSDEEFSELFRIPLAPPGSYAPDFMFMSNKRYEHGMYEVVCNGERLMLHGGKSIFNTANGAKSSLRAFLEHRPKVAATLVNSREGVYRLDGDYSVLEQSDGRRRYYLNWTIIREAANSKKMVELLLKRGIITIRKIDHGVV